MKGVSQNASYNERVTLNKGYIWVPTDVDRDRFVKNCYNREKVSVLIEDGGTVKHNCYILKNVIQDIKFGDSGKIGSAVIFFSEPYSGQIVVVGVVSRDNESQLLTEESFKVHKGKDGNYVITVFDGKNGVLSVDTFSLTGKGGLYINISNNDRDTELNVNVQGTINIIAHQDINITSSQTVNILPSKFNVGSGAEQMVLGNTLFEKLDALLDAIKLITVPTAFGPSGTPNNAASFTAIQNDLEEILSELSNTD